MVQYDLQKILLDGNGNGTLEQRQFRAWGRCVWGLSFPNLSFKFQFQFFQINKSHGRATTIAKSHINSWCLFLHCNFDGNFVLPQFKLPGKLFSKNKIILKKFQTKEIKFQLRKKWLFEDMLCFPGLLTNTNFKIKSFSIKMPSPFGEVNMNPKFLIDCSAKEMEKIWMKLFLFSWPHSTQWHQLILSNSVNHFLSLFSYDL